MSLFAVFPLSGRGPAPKVTVLRDYLELSEQSIHKTVTDNHFLAISDEFGADSDRGIGLNPRAAAGAAERRDRLT